MERIFQITESKLHRLLEADAELEYLVTIGVDNWEWYGEHYKGFVADCMNVSLEEARDKEYSLYDYVDKIISELKDDEVIR